LPVDGYVASSEGLVNDVGNGKPCKVRKLNVQGTSVLVSCCARGAHVDNPEWRQENKLQLLRALLMGQDLFSCNLVHDGLGRPLIALNNGVGPAISFSHCNGVTWAALTGGEADVGIDAERAEEFNEDYPFHRVFQIDELGDELTPSLKHTGGNRGECAALVWSAKEAFVKALGCAFHFFSPLEVNASPLDVRFDRALFRVRLSDRGAERLSRHRGSHMEVSSFRIDGAWVSVAAVIHDRGRPLHSVVLPALPG
jgi:phosphopantetheinyl transferase (holo-ACP synthase)